MTIEQTLTIASQANLPVNLTYPEVEELTALIADSELTTLFDHLVSFLQEQGKSQTGSYRLTVEEVKQVAECI